MNKTKLNSGKSGELKKFFDLFNKPFGKILLWIFIFLLGLYSPDIRKLIDEQIISVKHLFARAPSIEIRRSLFNNTFYFTKSTSLQDSIVLTGENVSYQLWARVKNNSDEELIVNNLGIESSRENMQVAKNEYGQLGTRVNPLDSVILKVETSSLLGQDDILRLIEKGKLMLVLNSNLGNVSKEIDCICFFNGQKMPNGKFLYTIGKDTNCIDFELNNPEGLKGTGNPEVTK